MANLIFLLESPQILPISFVADFNNHRIQVFEFASIVACSSDEIRITTGCIIDNAAPIITITGPGSVTILQNSTYTVLPPTIYDIDPNYDGSFTASSTTSPLDTSTIETVTITYMATDPSNNTGTATQSIDNSCTMSCWSNTRFYRCHLSR